MTTFLVPESSEKFHCNICDYSTSRKSQYVRHLSTSKHNNTTNTTNLVPESSAAFNCDCGNTYKHRQSLYNHKRKCQILLGNTSEKEKNANAKREIIPEIEKMVLAHSAYNEIITSDKDKIGK